MSVSIMSVRALCNKQRLVACNDCPFWELDPEGCYFKTILPFDWDITDMEHRTHQLRVMWKNKWPKYRNSHLGRSTRMHHKPQVGKGSGAQLHRGV